MSNVTLISPFIRQMISDEVDYLNLEQDNRFLVDNVGRPLVGRITALSISLLANAEGVIRAAYIGFLSVKNFFTEVPSSDLELQKETCLEAFRVTLSSIQASFNLNHFIPAFTTPLNDDTELENAVTYLDEKEIDNILGNSSHFVTAILPRMRSESHRLFLRFSEIGQEDPSFKATDLDSIMKDMVDDYIDPMLIIERIREGLDIVGKIPLFDTEKLDEDGLPLLHSFIHISRGPSPSMSDKSIRPKARMPTEGSVLAHDRLTHFLEEHKSNTSLENDSSFDDAFTPSVHSDSSYVLAEAVTPPKKEESKSRKSSIDSYVI